VCFLGAKIQIKASSFYDEVTAFLFLEKKTYVSIDLFCSFVVKTCASICFFPRLTKKIIFIFRLFNWLWPCMYVLRRVGGQERAYSRKMRKIQTCWVCICMNFHRRPYTAQNAAFKNFLNAVSWDLNLVVRFKFPTFSFDFSVTTFQFFHQNSMS
jgi:hypothetical protein